jgi:hypothetical protein
MRVITIKDHAGGLSSEEVLTTAEAALLAAESQKESE